MTSRRRTIRLLGATLLVTAVFALGACGGSSSGDAAPTTATTATTGTDEGSSPSTTAAGDESGSSDAGGDFCQQIAASEGDDDVSAAEAVARYQSLLEVAPAEVQSDLEVIIEYFEVTGAGLSDPAAVQKLTEIGPEYTAASGRLVEYVNANC